MKLDRESAGRRKGKTVVRSSEAYRIKRYVLIIIKNYTKHLSLVKIIIEKEHSL
jgi:hypothetical protein